MATKKSGRHATKGNAQAGGSKQRESKSTVQSETNRLVEEQTTELAALE